jgi:hypothetical protein
MSFKLRSGLFVSVLLASCALAQAAQPVTTAALNRDPQVQDGFQRFYNLDYDGSLQVFQKVLQQHPTDPLAVDYVLSVVVFRELYRQDLLDTTLYAHEGFLTGKHIVTENAAVKLQVERLANQAVSLAIRATWTPTSPAAWPGACTRPTLAWPSGVLSAGCISRSPREATMKRP